MMSSTAPALTRLDAAVHQAAAHHAALGPSVAAFAVVAGLVTLTPGLDTALVLRTAVVRGRRAGFVAGLGISAGVLAWALAAAVGASALLAASRTAYTALQLAGALYMCWLGVNLLRRVIRPAGDGRSDLASGSDGDDLASGSDGDDLASGSDGDDLASGSDGSPVRLGASFRQGLFTNLLNPKVGAFYLAMLPQFIPDGVPHAAAGVLLGLVHVTEGTLWFGLLVTGTHLVRGWLERPTSQRITDAVTGTVLVAFGAHLALDRP